MRIEYSVKSLKLLLYLGIVLFLCLSVGCLDSGSRRLKYYNSDTCKEAKAGNAIMFGGMAWGASPGEVLAALGQQPVFQDEQVLVFEDNIVGMPVQAVYYFFDNQLMQGQYIFTQKHRYENTYLEDFHKIEDLLTQKYDEPAVADSTWTNTMFEAVPKDFGLAISLGHMSMLAGRKVGCIKFYHRITGGDNQIQHTLLYEHIKLKADAENARAGAKL